MPKQRSMQFLGAAALAAALCAGATSATAQTPAAAPVQLDQLQIVVWPEYDRPDALVIYRMRLTSATPLPAKVHVRIPAAVGKPHAVARRGPDGTLLVADHTYAAEGDWADVVITTDNHELQLEYYAPLVRDGAKRVFAAEWPGGGTPVKLLAYEVQEPLGSINVTIQPPPSERSKRADGLFYNVGTVPGRAPDQPGSIQLGYEKTDDRLTAELLRASAAQAPTQPPPGPGPGPAPATGTPTAPVPPPGAVKDAKDGGGGTSWAMIGLLVVAAFAAGIWIGRASVAGGDEDEEDS